MNKEDLSVNLFTAVVYRCRLGACQCIMFSIQLNMHGTERIGVVCFSNCNVEASLSHDNPTGSAFQN